MGRIKRILVPVDFHPASLEALHSAACLSEGLNAELTILSVIEWPGRSADHDDPLEIKEDEQTRVRERLSEAAGREGLDVKRNRVAVRIGRPEEEILRAAREHGADLIVMGTHGRQGLSRVLMGSVAESILRRAPCPVLVQRRGIDLGAEAGEGSGPRKVPSMTDAEKGWWQGE